MIADPRNQALTIDALSLGMSNNSPEIRAKAAEAMGHLSNVSLSEELRQSAVDRLVASFGDSDTAVRTAVLRAVAKLADETVIPQLVPLLEDAEATVRDAATAALGTIGTETAIAHLQALLGDRDPS